MRRAAAEALMEGGNLGETLLRCRVGGMRARECFPTWAFVFRASLSER